MDLFDTGRLVLVISSPALLVAVAVAAQRCCAVIARVWPEHQATDPQPVGPPIERLAADLRRLLRLHALLTDSAHQAMRAHRIWAVEAALVARAIEAAVALDVPHPEPRYPEGLRPEELSALVYALSDAGMVLPARVGPFVG